MHKFQSSYSTLQVIFRQSCRTNTGLLQKAGLYLMKNLLKPLAKSVLIPLGLTVVASATVAVIQKNIFGSGITTWISSN